MRTNNFISGLKAAVRAGSVLLFAAVAAFGQQQVNLTAGPAGITMADGNSVPMWGYRCGAVPAVTSSATCAYLAGPTSPAALGALGAISVINGGSGYTSAPTVTITGGGGLGAVAVAAIANGQVVSITLTSFGAGYTSAPAVTLSGGAGTGATATAGPAWSPVVITVPTGAAGGLQINLTNNLYSSLLTGTGTTPLNPIPTSIMIVGQVGGGLGVLGQRTTTAAPDHSNAQGIYTWVTANLPGSGIPPVQGPRVMSFATEVLPAGATALTNEGGTPCALVSGACALTWSNLRPGTYLLESGTHPSIQAPMGLVGVLVVTCSPTAAAGACGTGIATGTAYPAVTGTSPAPAYPAVTYNAEIPLEFSEIDPVQNDEVNIAVNTAGFSETAVWSALATGPLTTTHIVSGGSGYTVPTATVVGANGSGATVSLTVTGGVITGATLTAQGSGYSGTSPANVIVTDPTGSGAIITAMASPNTMGCGAATVHTCYPPAVNYTPFYYLINGVAFNKAYAASSNFPVAPDTGVMAGTGTVLARLVNAGLRMHVPSIVGSQTTGFNGAGAAAPVGGFTLVAEDGNVIPNLLPNTNLTGQVPAPKVQTDVFMAAGKTYDVMINAPTTGNAALPIYARDLALSGNSSERDAGMLAYISVNGATLPTFGTGVVGTPTVMADTYNSVVPCDVTTPQAPCIPLVVSDVSKGVMANDSNVYGVQLAVGPTAGTLTCGATPGNAVPGLCANGTFIYTPNAGTWTSDTFTYCANGTTQTSTPSYCAPVTLGATTEISTLTMSPITYTAHAAGYISIPPPGPLSVDKDSAGFPLNVVTTPAATPGSCASLTIEPNGGFIATAPTTATSCSFTYTATNNHHGAGTTTVTIDFPPPSNLSVTIVDGAAYKAAGCNATVNMAACVAALPQIKDYRWIIEEDKTFYINPACTTNTATTPPAGCPQPTATTVPPTFAVNFHTSHMEYVAQGCTGTQPTDQSCEEGQTVLGVPSVCEVGNGVCVPGTARTPLMPSQVALNPYPGLPPCTGATTTTGCAPYPMRYYISALPGDAGNPFTFGYSGNPAACTPVSGGTPTCGHGMGGAPISWNPALNGGAGGWNPVVVISEPSPYQPGKLSVQVFEDDFPLNGEQDAGGGVDVIASNEPGLGGFEIVLWDSRAQFGDNTGQMTHDMFNQPLSNSLAGTIDPATGNDACPLSPEITGNALGTPGGSLQGLTGRIVTCPKYESDGKTLSPLAGEAIVNNLMPMQLVVQAYPGADRIARGEEWLQTNTLDGQHPHDAFVKIGEPAYFQEYGPAGFHVSIGFANPAIINARYAGVCNGTDLNLQASNCTNTVTGKITLERLSRPPDERLYGSGSHDAYYWTQCWVSLGDPDGEDFMFTKCDANGNFTFTGVPSGDWRIVLGDQWNDGIIDGLSTPVGVPVGSNQTINMGELPVQQWQSNLYTRTFIDDNKDGVYQSSELGIPFLNTTVRYRDGSMANNLLTDFTGTANFNETFPLFNWYVVETDNTRYKTTGTHTVYDVGGPADGTSCGGTNPACGPSGTPYAFLANTYENLPLPSNLSVPGAVYCTDATCSGSSIWTSAPNSQGNSSGRIDPPWVFAEGWQGHIGQGNFIEFGKTPYAPGENGGIRGHVVYASTRPFDDPQMLVQTQWTPLIPHVTMNLYQEGFATDGVTPTLTLVDTTQTSSWDDWAQGFRSDSIPNINCPGQGAATGTNADLFFYSIYNQPNYLNLYNYYYNNGPLTALPYNSQYKCYDGMHSWNQIQPAPYDGVYQFPSVLGITPSGTGAGKLNTALTGGVGTPGTSSFAAATMKGTNCTICIPNPDTTDPWRVGTPMLPAGKYVVEVVVPPGYELVKEEDKNILIGDNFIAPINQQFGGLANIFILPDQASVASMYDPSGAGYNANNAQEPTQSIGFASTTSTFVPGFLEPNWPCVGEARIVPDYMSLFPQAHQVAAFAGATRNLCDRKEVTLPNQMAATAKFWLFTSTHIASKYTGIITDDFTSEFDPFSPTFGEKFSPPYQPVSTRDWNGLEISRVYSDEWGGFNGLTYSTWEVNPPNPTGYAPSMFVQCMNDAGPILDTRQTIVNSAGQTVPNPTYGQLINDPLFNPLYSQFCYENPYLPGITGYLDTPVVPTAGFVGAGYNNVDCYYPANTPAISEVDGDGIGPYVSKSGNTLTITALGDEVVTNYGYTGPSANTPPFNTQTITRHYGFGTQCVSATATGCSAVSSVTIGGVPAPITSWSDTQIVVTVPGATPPGSPQVPPCKIQQQAQYGGSLAHCGELVITAGNGLQSVDTVTVTIGGKAPTHVAASGSIQAAIDAAAPGDLIIVDPTSKAGCVTSTGAATACNTTGATVSLSASNHRELLMMWKPVRLQGVGAASSIIDASTHPAGSLKLDPWRRSVNCLFGLTLNGQPPSSTNPFDNPTDNNGHPYTCPTPSSPTASGLGPNGNIWKYFYGGPNYPQLVVDRIPLEGILGWDATVNGNLAEQLQEPSIMGAYEGAAITVVAKGVNIPAGSTDVYGSGAEATFPTGSTLLTGTVGPNGTALTGDLNPLCHTSLVPLNLTNQYPSNFICNPSSIDGLGITDSSQGGGAVFLHAWTHYLQMANNRVYNNAGTLSGGMVIGQGEFPEAILAPNATAAAAIAPGSCEDSPITNTQLPYCQQLNVNIHHNMVINNSATGDELFTGTPAGAGGVSICTGSDYYNFNYNWVCGNFSSGDGGGVGHLGFSYNGDIEHNTIIFNQSTNTSIPANGGGLLIEGAAPDATITVNGVATECGSVTDNDCVPGLSDGTGPGLVINANLIEGNGAEAGSGGGIRLQGVNGADVARFPANPERWYHVIVENNIINNNVAGWDGGGISLEDALAVELINNTVASNDTTASSGSLFRTLGAPLASSQSPTPNCLAQNGGVASCPQPAGLVTMQNSPQLTTSFTTGQITCPPGNYAPGTPANGGTGKGGGTCINISYPAMYYNIFWQNRSFQIGVGPLGTGTQNQQNVVSLYNAAFNGGLGSAAASQTSTGACPAGSSYWDIGVRNDKGPANHGSGYTLDPLYSVLTSNAGYSGTNMTSNPLFGTGSSGYGTPTGGQYCNGSRVPPEAGGLGWQVPAGIADSVVPNPIFSLSPTATVDEGNNWVNISWGPLSTLNPVTSSGTTNVVLGNYSLQTSSPAINAITCTEAQNNCQKDIGVSGVNSIVAPTTDFFGDPRPDNANPNHIDVGAVEIANGAGRVSGSSFTLTPPSLGFGNEPDRTTSASQLVTLTNTGTGTLTVNSIGFTGTNPLVFEQTNTCGTLPATIAVGGSCTINVSFAPGLNGSSTAAGPKSANLRVASNGAGTQTVALTGTTTVGTPSWSAMTPSLVTGTTTAHSGTITLTNAPTSSGPLNLTAAPTVVKTAGPGSFAVTGGTCTTGPFPRTIVTGGNCTVTVQYAPSGTTSSTAHIAITDTGDTTATQNSPNFNAN